MPWGSTFGGFSGSPSLAGTFAGLAGGLYAYAKGSVFPNLMAIPRSVDALVMVLLGGVQTLTGPVVGAAVFHSLNTEMVRHTEYWRLLLGVSIIVLVLVFPMGIAGAFRRRERAA